MRYHYFKLFWNHFLLQEVLAGSAYWACEEGSCGSCAISILQMKEKSNSTYGDLLQEYTELLEDFGSTSQDRSLSRLSCHSTEQMWFDVMRSYGDVGRFLSVFSLFGIILYFVTSSDSGSLVIDCLSANGKYCCLFQIKFQLTQQKHSDKTSKNPLQGQRIVLESWVFTNLWPS